MGPNDVFVLKVAVNRSDAFALAEDVKRPRPGSNVATAEMLDIAKRRRREIPTNCVCSILNSLPLNLRRRSPSINKGCVIAVTMVLLLQPSDSIYSLLIASPDCRYEASQQCGDFIRGRIQGKVAGVENVHFGFGN